MRIGVLGSGIAGRTLASYGAAGTAHLIVKVVTE
jgi:hypothetical protein